MLWGTMVGVMAGAYAVMRWDAEAGRDGRRMRLGRAVRRVVTQVPARDASRFRMAMEAGRAALDNTVRMIKKD